MKNLSTTSAAVDTAAAAADLKTLIHDHDQFFDKLIELIPAKFYLPTDEDSKPWFQGLSKGKKASLKQQTRENIKKSRRDRLDPEKAQTTTLDLLKKIVGKNEDSDEEDDDDDEEEEEMEIKVARPQLCSDHFPDLGSVSQARLPIDGVINLCGSMIDFCPSSLTNAA
ncbi:hypothetical protein Ccrd_001949, partial [Cynara cardunculus var. scolymus]